MQLFTELGMPTGFDKGGYIKGVDVGGNYEWPVRGARMNKPKYQPTPYIFKEPKMCTDIDIRAKKMGWTYDHVYILLRRPGPVANALEFMRRGTTVSKEEFDYRVRTYSIDRIERGFTNRIQNLIHILAELEVPVTMVSYPKWAAEWKHGYRKFRWLLDKCGISKEAWRQVCSDTINKNLIDQAYADFPEWHRSYMREKYGFGNLR